MEDALARFSRWIGLPELAPPRMVKASNLVECATKDGAWQSVVAVCVYHCSDWSIFEDLTGHLATFSAEQFRKLAGQEDVVFAGYNDSVPYVQLIVVQRGIIVREFLDDRQDPRNNVNRGRIDIENESPINDWTDAALFVDEDNLVPYGDDGLLWMFGERRHDKS